MIRKVNLKCTSYKELSSLETNKKFNLIYGLNGSGKSTFSEFIRKIDDADEKFSECSIETDNEQDNSKLASDEKILVYNQKWINEAFYENPTLRGIFSLSKENADAKRRIDNANKEKEKLEKLKTENLENKVNAKKSFDAKKANVLEIIWKIKTDYTGGDRKTGQFFTGLQTKEKLFEHILKIQKPSQELSRNINDIKNKLTMLLDKNATKINSLNNVQFENLSEQEILLLQKEITGSKNSTFASLIDELKNSDWVNTGLKYIANQKELTKCPFCQQEINKEHLLKELKNCFDKTYEQDKQKLQNIFEKYEMQVSNIVAYSAFAQHDLLKDLSANYDSALSKLKLVLEKNLNAIKEKNSTPSKPVALDSINTELFSLNEVIRLANGKINDFNATIDKKDEAIQNLKSFFWQNIRLQYDVVITNYQSEKSVFDKKQNDFDVEISKIQKQIDEQDEIITKQSKLVSNIDDAVTNINKELLDLGIDSFKIIKHNEEKAEYKLIRSDKDEDNVFSTLSEGEKMIISFLYFVEECKGKENSKTADEKKIIVIDDPISSLSHIYVFNVGTLIKKEFFFGIKKNYEQIFILTHNLYFFYELAKPLHDKKNKEDKTQETNLNLFRIIKSTKGSNITSMKYSEIQNDYQMYWSVVNDKNNKPALIANCMRNIIDYFFGFIEKNELNNVFQKEELKANKYQAFYRYINRESHSDNTNIYDMKEFDYDSFIEAFRKVFELSGYKKHYERMSKIGISG